MTKDLFISFQDINKIFRHWSLTLVNSFSMCCCLSLVSKEQLTSTTTITMSEDSCNKLIVRMGIIIQNLVIFLIFFSYKLTAKPWTLLLVYNTKTKSQHCKTTNGLCSPYFLWFDYCKIITNNKFWHCFQYQRPKILQYKFVTDFYNWTMWNTLLKWNKNFLLVILFVFLH